MSKAGNFGNRPRHQGQRHNRALSRTIVKGFRKKSQVWARALAPPRVKPAHDEPAVYEFADNHGADAFNPMPNQLIKDEK